MPSYTLDGNPLPFGPFSTTDQGGQVTQHPANVLILWTDAELADIGVGRIPDPPAPPVRVLSAIDFMKRLPLTSRAAIMQAADAPDYVLKAFLTMIEAASNGIDLDDDDTVQAVGYLQSKNLIDARQAAAMLA